LRPASSYFSESDRKRINESVRAAEATTSAEIVPVVVTVSGRYDRAEDIIGLWLGILLMIATSVLWPPTPVSTESGSWDADPSFSQAFKLILVMLFGFVLGAILGSRIGWLRRLFAPSRQMTDEVRESAHSIYFDQRIHHTQTGSGLLIYVSLFERIAVILADQTVLQAVGQSTLDELCKSLTEKLRQSGPTEAMCQTIHAASEKLRDSMPNATSNVNELPDSLVVID